MSEITEEMDELDENAFNGELIPFDGWVVIMINLPGNVDPSLSISVPFLVSSLTMNTSDHLVFFEVEQGSQPLEQLNLGTDLFKIQNSAKPYVMIVAGNITKHDVTIPWKTALGTLQHIEKIVDADPPNKLTSIATVNEVTSQPTEPTPSLCHLPVNLNHLEEEQQDVAKRMLYEESKVSWGMEMTSDVAPVCKWW